MTGQALRARAADMLSAYIEAIKASGQYEHWHYIPEVEEVIEALREGREAADLPDILKFEVVINRNIPAGAVRLYQEGKLVGEIRNIKEPS